MVVLRCEESIDVQPLYLVSAELDVFDELQMVGYGKSFGFEKRWIQLKNTNLLKKPNKNMILDTIDSAAMDYEGFSGSLIADYNNCIVGIANMQNVEKGKANSLLGISVKNRKKFFENNNIPVYDRAALLNVRCEETKAKAFQNGIDQNVYLKNKQLENDTNSRNIEENTNPLLNMSNVYSEDYNWNIKYTRIEGLLGNSNKRRKERKELTKQWAKEFEQYPGWLIVPADFRQQVKSYTNGKELLQCSEKELESNLDYCNELLDFAYEYTRRYKKSCLPLDKNIENNLYKIWDTLNSHSDLKEKNKNKWFTVGLYLLENYRQNMDEEKWNSICDLLKPCTNFIVDGKYYLKLEEILMNLFKMDLEKVQLELVSCSLEEMPYEVRLRFIGVMTECGLNEEALKAVEEQLAVWNRYYVDEWSAKEKEWFLELFIGCCSDMVKYWKESKYDFQFTFSKWHMKMMIRAIASFGRNGWKGTNPVQSKKLCTLLKEFYDEGIYSWEVEAMFLADEKVPAFMNEMLELMYETESDMVFSATMAVEKCLETIMDQQLKENTLLELFNLIKARKEPGLEYFLMIIHNIFYRTNSRFPSKIMKGVSQVLRLVEKYTRINFQTSTQEEFKENIKVRKQCATLAFLVYRFENTFYEGQHCPEVEEWRDICTGEKSENEFAEVKNCWLLPEL